MTDAPNADPSPSPSSTEPGDLDGALIISLPKRGRRPATAAGCVKDAGLDDALRAASSGPFGLSSVALAALEGLSEAVDGGLAAAHALSGLVRESTAVPGELRAPALDDEQQRFVGAFQIVVTCDLAALRLAALTESPSVDGALELDGLEALLSGRGAAGDAAVHRATRVMRMARRYLDVRGEPPDSTAAPAQRARTAIGTLSAFLTLLRRAVSQLAKGGALRPLVAALSAREVRVAGHRYDGFTLEDVAPKRSTGLLPLWPDDIVGNDDYLEAGMRLARDVAGYDFEARRNPKRINPVLFGLGKPGCGKTVTAHAIGNYFLRYCEQRDVPARFLVVRRTDWASSYQNASALNLVRLFEEDVYGFDGVCGVYWPDIDTALASRSSSGLRMEEKQNLGAVFGVFDGTLLPRDGKWFLICDANTLHMDEAAISRIAQNPFDVEGPTTPAHFAQLMRDLKLRDVADFVEADADAWLHIGERAAELELSGRAVEAICGNIAAHIQDFEFPDVWFDASAEERRDLLEELCTRVDADFVLDEMERWSEFHRDAEERAEQERFEREVDAMVRQLNAGREAAERAVEAGSTGLPTF